METNYFLIRLVDAGILFENRSLTDITKKLYPIFYEREQERIRLLNMRPTADVKQTYNEFEKETDLLYEEMGIPKYLIVSGNEKKANELITETEITVKNPSILYVRRASYEKTLEYYNSSSYDTKIHKFYSDYCVYEKKLLQNSHNLECHISGYLNGKYVDGNFKGKVKIKRIK